MIDYNNLSEEEQIKLVKNIRFLNASEDGLTTRLAISFIKIPSEKVQLAAVKTDGWGIKYIKNPSKEVQLEAVKQCPYILNDIYWYIKNPCQEILDFLMIKDIIE